MPRKKVWEWQKEGDGDFHANWNDELPTGVTLSSPTVEMHERTADDPVTWTDRTSEVTITASVVNALDEHGAEEAGGTSRGIRVVITQDPDSQPDVTDEPEPGTKYRVMIVVTRSDYARPMARDVPLRIRD